MDRPNIEGYNDQGEIRHPMTYECSVCGYNKKRVENKYKENICKKCSIELEKNFILDLKILMENYGIDLDELDEILTKYQEEIRKG